VQAELENVRRQALEEISSTANLQDLERLRQKFVGRKGVAADYIKMVSLLPAGERPSAGRKANELKKELIEKLRFRETEIKKAAECREKIPLDFTLPGVKHPAGKLHPITQTISAIEKIFGELGFKPVLGPEIETEYYNFEALNIHSDHPARDDQDSFYLDDKTLLRTQTSPVQIRIMEECKPPVRIIASGKCYRRDATDASHSSQFHQVEGLLVDKNVSFSDLKGVLKFFIQRMFGVQIRMRLRPDFFPFTEPSADVSISCPICGGDGCSSCGWKGWLEILGAGMVDPEVFKNVGYDPELYSGFAFGIGVERIAMLKHGINDIRIFLENDIRFLKQF